MADVITFDGTELPCPSTQSYEGQQLVDSARNAEGKVVAQKINRRQVKLSLTWKALKPEEVSLILNCVEKFSGDTRYFDAKAGRFITRKMYWGDYSVETYWVDENGRPKLFTNLSTSLIDMGEGA
jgi:hypothetical protein|nr:MAG TPA: hypothetical protein [Caudoviricetes sp.]